MKIKLTKTIERIGTILYFVGLLSFPFYKVFIESGRMIDTFSYFCIAIGVFLLYLVGWWFLYTPICAIIASFFFLKGEDAKDMRWGCLYPALSVIAFLIACIVFNQYTKSTETEGLYSPANTTESPVVYMCTGGSAKKYHASKECRWLENCSGDIKETTVDEAVGSGRKPCKSCYK